MAVLAIQLLLVWATGCCLNVAAQYGFTIPNPAVADMDPSNTIVQGTVFNFVWIVNYTYQPTVDGQILLDDNGDISLWLTSFKDNSYTHCLAASVFSGGGGSWAYAVDLTDDEIDANDGEFVYRLKPTVSSQDAPYDVTEDEVPSRGFLIEKASDVAAASSSAAAAASASSASVAAAAASSRSAASESAAAAASASAASEAAAQASSASESAALAASQSAAAQASESAAEASSASLAAQTTSPPEPSSMVPTSVKGSSTPTITSGGSQKSAAGTNTVTTGTAAEATSTGTGSPSLQQKSDGGLSAGAKAGIAIGAVAIALLAAIALLLFLRHRKKAIVAAQHPPGPPTSAPVKAQDVPKQYAEHHRQNAPQYMGSPMSQHQTTPSGYNIPPPPQAYQRPGGEAAELGGYGAPHGAQELPNPHGYGYGAELPAYEQGR